MIKLTLSTGEPATLLLDLGQQPVSHKFLQGQDSEEESYPVRLGIGNKSGLVGLIDPPPWQALVPVYSWIKCNEPEDHLDELADMIQREVAVSHDKQGPGILGLSDKDTTLLRRLENKGFGDTTLFSHPNIDVSTNSGVETVQALISQGVHAQQKYDLIIGRHILEHTSDTKAFLDNILSLLSEQGVLVLEVPDNQKAFASEHHTIIWEEHSLYFTEDSLCSLLEDYGLDVSCCLRYPMALEDILVVIISKQERPANQKNRNTDQPGDSLPLSQTDSVNIFAQSFTDTKQRIRQKLLACREEFGALAVLGAGHFGAAFINYYQLSDIIDAVIDDDPNKQGLFMPGSKLPIQNSENLNDGTYRCCLLTCNPWNNHKIASRNQSFIARGGQFLSVFQLEEWL